MRSHLLDPEGTLALTGDAPSYRCIPTMGPLPTRLADPDADEAQLSLHPWVEPPFRVDYGRQCTLGASITVGVASLSALTPTPPRNVFCRIERVHQLWLRHP